MALRVVAVRVYSFELRHTSIAVLRRAYPATSRHTIAFRPAGLHSLDRSLLLAELLRVKGDKVRLVHASLSAEQAKDLVGKARPVPKNRLAAIEESSDDHSKAHLDDYARRFSLDAGALKTASEKDA